MFVQSPTFVLGLKCLWARSRVHLDQHLQAVTCRSTPGVVQDVICHALPITLRNPTILPRIAFTQKCEPCLEPRGNLEEEVRLLAGSRANLCKQLSRDSINSHQVSLR